MAGGNEEKLYPVFVFGHRYDGEFPVTLGVVKDSCGEYDGFFHSRLTFFFLRLVIMKANDEAAAVERLRLWSEQEFHRRVAYKPEPCHRHCHRIDNENEHETEKPEP